jgi:hypothetical protein
MVTEHTIISPVGARLEELVQLMRREGAGCAIRSAVGRCDTRSLRLGDDGRRGGGAGALGLDALPSSRERVLPVRKDESSAMWRLRGGEDGAVCGSIWMRIM